MFFRRPSEIISDIFWQSLKSFCSKKYLKTITFRSLRRWNFLEIFVISLSLFICFHIRSAARAARFTRENPQIIDVWLIDPSLRFIFRFLLRRCLWWAIVESIDDRGTSRHKHSTTRWENSKSPTVDYGAQTVDTICLDSSKKFFFWYRFLVILLVERVRDSEAIFVTFIIFSLCVRRWITKKGAIWLN